MSFANTLLERLRSVVTDAAFRPLHEPEFRGNEWAYVKECLDTGWVSSVGAFVDRFERDLAATCGVAHAVAVVNGTAALHVALRLAGVQAGDEVLCPSITFIATANAITYCGAVPHFVDIEADTLGLDPQALAAHLSAIAEPTAGGYRNRQTGRRLAAVVPVHVFGHPVRMAELLEVAARFGLPVIEDSTESLGSLRDGRPTGGDGLLGTLSFNGNKIMTTGGGGAILTNDSELARHAKYLTTTAKKPHRWDFVHDEIGYNYRLPNMNAALGCAQLEQLAGFVSRKRALADRYHAAFAGVSGVSTLRERPGTCANYWLNALILDEDQADQRDAVLTAFNDAGFQSRPLWTPMHQLAIYADCPRAALSVSESMSQRVINIPSSPKLAEPDDQQPPR